MPADEQAIREVVDCWMQATRSGDIKTVLDLMTDDVVFMVPGREPFGKEAFEATLQGIQNHGMRIEGTNEVREIQVLGGWAWIRNYIDISVTPPGGGNLNRRSGWTLTILKKCDDGRWRLTRDANLLNEKQ